MGQHADDPMEPCRNLSRKSYRPVVAYMGHNDEWGICHEAGPTPNHCQGHRIGWPANESVLNLGMQNEV